MPADITGAPIVLDGDAGDEHWLTFRNFRAIWSYNNSIRYATAVYQLSQLIAAAPEVASPVPGAEPQATASPVPVAEPGQPGA